MISEAEQTILSKYIFENKESNIKLLEALKTNGQSKEKELCNVLENIYPQSDKNALDLYYGKKNWGEYNQKRKELKLREFIEYQRIYVIK